VSLRIVWDPLSFAHCDIRLQPNTIPLQGRLKNFNTIEEFRSPDLKKDLFNETVKHLIASFSASATNGTPIPARLVCGSEKVCVSLLVCFSGVDSEACVGVGGG
jgi:hypothetical protein